MGWYAQSNRDSVRKQISLVGWMVFHGATWQCILSVLEEAEDPPFFNEAQSFGRVCRELLTELDPDTMSDAEGIAVLRSLGFRGVNKDFLGSRNGDIRSLLLRDEARNRERAKSALAALADMPILHATLQEREETIADLQNRLAAALRCADAKTAENHELWRASLDQQDRNQALRMENQRLSSLLSVD